MSRKTTDINERLNELRKDTRDQYLKLMKIDPDAVKEIETSENKRHEELIRELQRKIKDTGKEAKQHFHKSVENYHLTHDKAIQILAEPPSLAEGIQFWPCYCFPYISAKYVDKNCSTLLDVGNVQVECTEGETSEASQLKVDAKGPGAGESKGKVSVKYTYTFEPPKTGTYCISPHVFLNGHYLAWSWGSCNVPVNNSVSKAKVYVKVQVDQYSMPVKTHKHKVLDITEQSGTGSQSGFSYNSLTDGGVSTKAYLQGGDDAVVFVEIIGYASVLKHGRAIVDMKTSPNFGCIVDNVLYARRICRRWPPVLIDVLEALQI